MKILSKLNTSIQDKKASKKQHVNKTEQIMVYSDAYNVVINPLLLENLIEEKIAIYNPDALYYTEQLKVIKKLDS